MKLNRKKTRKLLFQKLYAMSFWNFDNESFTESFYDWVFNFDMDKVYYNEMSELILKNEWFYLEILSKYAPKFELPSMNIIYVLPIFIGLAEMFHLTEEIPAKVSINEAVEMWKAFWDDSAKKIVNGVLNKVYENHDELKKLSINSQWNIDFSFFK